SLRCRRSLSNLVTKWLVTADVGATVQYRRLETTRAAAHEKLIEAGNSNTRHGSTPNTIGASVSKPRPNGKHGPRLIGWWIMASSSATCARDAGLGPFRRAARHRSPWRSLPLRYPYGFSAH